MKLILISIFSVLVSNLYPTQHDARYLLLKKEYIFNTDGGYTLNYEHRLEYKTYHSFHRLFGETFVVYNPEYQTLKINRMQTTMANGKLIAGPQNALNEVLPSWAANSGAYNQLREMVITHTGLEIGAVADLSYTIESKKPSLGYIQVLEPLRINMPVDDLELVFVVPEGIDFSISERPGMPRPEIITEAGKVTYRYRLVDVPAIESFGVVDQAFVPHVQAQTGKMTLAELFAQIDPLALEIKPLSPEEFELALDIQKDIMGIRTINVPLDFQAFPLQSPVNTIKRNSGTPLEKALAFQNRLLEKNIHARLLLKIPEPLADESHANILATTDVFLLLYVNQEPIALSPIRLHKENPIDVQGFAYVAASNDGLVRVSGKVTKTLKSNAEMTLNYDKKLNKTTFSGAIKSEMSGAGLNFLVKRSVQPKGSDIISAKGAEIVEFVSEEFSSQRFGIKIPETQLEPIGKVVHIDLPVSRQGFDSWQLGSLSDSIGSPVRLPHAITQEEVFTVNLPKGAKPISRQIIESKKAPFGEMELLLQFDKTKVSVTRKIIIRSSLILPKDYQVFLEMSRLWNFDGLKGIYIELK